MGNILGNVLSKKMLKDMKKNQHHYVLAALLALFIVMDIEVPRMIAMLIDNVLGKIVIIIVALSLFTMHPLVGSLALVAGYVLMMRSTHSSGSMATKLYVPTETKKVKHMRKMNVKPDTSLEEQTVRTMLPSVGKPLNNATFKPVLDKLHSASAI